ncbi:MAG: FRG domain-containing protein, partial [Planctomycetes bacterium]|nr:FRG domain-containing protein [Planctomycetota bacterium]
VLCPLKDALSIARFGEPIWFRGHTDPKWKLVPAIFRNDILPKDAHSKRSPEKWMLMEFIWQAMQRTTDHPMHNRRASWMALARHRGLPTRLLDWSESILAAAWFATEPTVGKKRKDSIVWALNPALMNRVLNGGGPLFVLDDRHPLVKAAYEAGEYSRQAWAVKGDQVDKRMMMQQAGFTIHGSPKDLADLCKEAPARFAMKFIIPAGAREQLNRTLVTMGVRRSMIYPDLANLSKDLSDEWKRRVAEANKAQGKRRPRSAAPPGKRGG